MRRLPNRSNLALVAIAATIFLALTGCGAGNPAPQGWRQNLQQAQKSSRGAWIHIDKAAGSVAGELIAVASDRIYVAQGNQLTAVALDEIVELRLAAYETRVGGPVGYGVLGALSTISHGYILVFSAPLWLLSTPVLATVHSREGLHHLEAKPPHGFTSPELVTKLHQKVRPYARFPQGLPPALMPQSRPDPLPPAGQGQPCAGEAKACASGLACDPASNTCVVDTSLGTEGASCYPNATCNQGLTCDAATQRCIAPPALGREGGPCFANGTCEDGLLCDNQRCVLAPATPSPNGAPPPEEQP